MKEKNSKMDDFRKQVLLGFAIAALSGMTTLGIAIFNLLTGGAT